MRVWTEIWREDISGALGWFFTTLLRPVVSMFYIKVVWGYVEAGNGFFLAVNVEICLSVHVE